MLDDLSTAPKRRLKGGNTATPVEGLRRFFRWTDDGKLLKSETANSGWQAKAAGAAEDSEGAEDEPT